MRRRRAFAIFTVLLSVAAWAMAIWLPEPLVHSVPVIAAINAIDICSLVVGVYASRQNKRFIGWRITSDVGLILGLVLFVLEVVSLIMFLKGIEFV